MEANVQPDDQTVVPASAQSIVPQTPVRTLATGLPAVSQAQKAAIILASFGSETASPIVERLSRAQLQTFVRAFEQIKTIPREQVLETIADFVTTVERMRGGLRGGPEEARRLAEKLMGEDRVRDLFTNHEGTPGEDGVIKVSVWSELCDSSVDEIARFVSTQKPEVGSIILSKLSNVKASEVLLELPDKLTVNLLSHVSRNLPVPDHVERAVETLIRTEFLGAETSNENNESLSYVSELLGMISKSKREAVLEGIKAMDSERAEKIRGAMLTFEDIPKRLPPTAVPIIFKELDKMELYKALKAGTDSSMDSVEYLYANISQRMATNVQEEVSAIPDLETRSADKAISTFMMFIGELVNEGRVTLIRPDT